MNLLFETREPETIYELETMMAQDLATYPATEEWITSEYIMKAYDMGRIQGWWRDMEKDPNAFRGYRDEASDKLIKMQPNEDWQDDDIAYQKMLAVRNYEEN